MKPHEAGMALLIAVWAVILMGGLVAGMVAMGGSEAAITANRIEAARARHLADAGIRRAILALADVNAREKLVLSPAASFQVQLEDKAEIAVQLRDSCAAIDLNWAPVEVLRAYAMVHGMQAVAAQLFAGAVAARRQAENPAGAPDEDNLNAGPWQNPEALAELPGMDPALLEAMRPGLTVNCREAGADPDLAMPDVKEALGLAGVNGMQSHGLAYDIEAQARLESGARVTARAAIWLSREPGPPYYYVTSWRTY